MAAVRSTLVLGGAASGKSVFAENLVLGLRGRAIYIATAQAFDDEMDRKIADHRARRGADWTTVEAPLDLAAALADADSPDTVILVDCLTLWLSNLMGAGRDIGAESDGLIDTLSHLQGRAVLVANEVGLGIVPENAVAREFRNLHGALNQAVAAAADRVIFVAAGLPLTLKGAFD